MPVEQGHILSLARVGMPAKEVVVILANLPSLVVMADVVEIGLRQGRMEQAEDQKEDPQNPGSMMRTKPPSHQFAWPIATRNQTD
jgi:hypothetical protein